jgi:hypothetical protein
MTSPKYVQQKVYQTLIKDKIAKRFYINCRAIDAAI